MRLVLYDSNLSAGLYGSAFCPLIGWNTCECILFNSHVCKVHTLVRCQRVALLHVCNVDSTALAVPSALGGVQYWCMQRPVRILAPGNARMS